MKTYLLDYEIGKPSDKSITVSKYETFKIGFNCECAECVDLLRGDQKLSADADRFHEYATWTISEDNIGLDKLTLSCENQKFGLNIKVVDSKITDQQVASGGGSSYVLPVATSSTLGGIKIGNNLSVGNDGKVGISEDMTVRSIYTSTDATIMGAISLGNGLVTESNIMAGSVLALNNIKTAKTVQCNNLSAANSISADNLYINGSKYVPTTWKSSNLTSNSTITEGNTIYNITSLGSVTSLTVDLANVGDEAIIKLNGSQTSNINICFGGYGLIDKVAKTSKAFSSRQTVGFNDVYFAHEARCVGIYTFKKCGSGYTYVGGFGETTIA